MSNKERMHREGQEDGFAIVELLIVIVVIAILAVISVVAYNGIQTRAADAAIKSDLRSAATQLALVQAEGGNFPIGTTPPSILQPSQGTTFQYTSVDGSEYCLTATSSRNGVAAQHVSNVSGVTEGACSGHSSGGTESAQPIALVQTFTHENWGSDVVVPVSTSAGSTLIASFAASGPNSTTVADNAGNTWTRIARTRDAGATAQRMGELWYVMSANPVTAVTISTSGSQNVIATVSEWTGIVGLRGYEMANNGTSTVVTPVQAQPGDMVLGSVFYYRSPIGLLDPEAGWTSAGAINRGNAHASTAYQMATSSGPMGPSWGSTAKATINAAFRNQ